MQNSKEVGCMEQEDDIWLNEDKWSKGRWSGCNGADSDGRWPLSDWRKPGSYWSLVGREHDLGVMEDL